MTIAPERRTARGPVPPRTNATDEHELVPPGYRRLKCRLGPLDGTRCMLAPNATELLVPLPPAAGVAARLLVYRVERRRRARGIAFEVLVFAGHRRSREGETG